MHESAPRTAQTVIRQISSQSVETICDSILRDFAKKKILVLAPLIQRKKGTHEKIFEQIKRDGYSRMRVDGEVLGLDEPVSLERQKWHSIEIVVDRIKVTRPERSRLFEAVQTAINASKGDVIIASDGYRGDIFTAKRLSRIVA